jgi:hypothetical protein
MMLGLSETYNDLITRDLNKTYPNAIDGDAVVFFGPTDGIELWVKYGSKWSPGWAPGTGPGMTMEARQDYKRIIDDQTRSDGPGFLPTDQIKVTTATSVNAGQLALIGLLGFLLLRGAIK